MGDNFFFQEDSAQVHCSSSSLLQLCGHATELLIHCACNTVKLSERCDFVFVFPRFAHVIWGGIVKRLLIAYFIGNISAKKYQNPFMCVKVTASQRWDVFLRHGVHGRQCNKLYRLTSDFADDVMSGCNRPGKGDANRAYTQSDSPGGSTGGEVWCLGLSYWLQSYCWENAAGTVITYWCLSAPLVCVIKFSWLHSIESCMRCPMADTELSRFNSWQILICIRMYSAVGFSVLRSTVHSLPTSELVAWINVFFLLSRIIIRCILLAITFAFSKWPQRLSLFLLRSNALITGLTRQHALIFPPS